MPSYAPGTRLETHEVANQPPEFAGRNLYETDLAFREAARREGGDWLEAPLSALGAEVGSERVLALGDEANRNPPELKSFDRYGRRLDEVAFHPAYHALMALAMEHRIHDIAWTSEGPGGHVAHLSMLALFTQAEAGVMCPINMTYAAVPALSAQPDVAGRWLGKLLGGGYDPDLKLIADKAGITLGMAMTEKQGGSDVRANTTRAFPLDGAGGRAHRLVGHKWFCSAPMSDGFLTLAWLDEGLSCFLVPRITPDGERNAIYLMRLKDKLGNRSNASSEIEYHDAYAELLGEPGAGVRVIIDMVHHTRLGTMGGALGIMRMALAQAVHHTSHRRAFQKALVDQPAMRAVLADLALEYEAAVVLAMRTARAFDAADGAGRAFARLSVALGKYWLTKRTPGFVYEVHGVPRRRRVRGGEPASAPLPRGPAQRDLGGLGQRHRARHPAHPGPRARRARGLGGGGGGRAGRLPRARRRSRRPDRDPAAGPPRRARGAADGRADGAGPAGRDPRPPRPAGGRRRLRRQPPRRRLGRDLRRPTGGSRCGRDRLSAARGLSLSSTAGSGPRRGRRGGRRRRSPAPSAWRR